MQNNGRNGVSTVRSAHPRGVSTPTLDGYCRVSTPGQADNGISLEEQETRIRQYAEAHGYDVLRVEIDRGVSAKTMNRPALQRALSHNNREVRAASVAALAALAENPGVLQK